MFFILFISFLTASYSQENQCLGSGDPKSDFYIQRLASREQRSAEIPQQIHTLKNRNQTISDTLHKNQNETLPNLQAAIENQNQRLDELKEKELDHAQQSLVRWKAAQDKKHNQWKQEQFARLKNSQAYKDNPRQATAEHQKLLQEREQQEAANMQLKKQQLAAQVNRILSRASQGNAERSRQITDIEAENLALEAELANNIESLHELNSELSDIEFIHAWRQGQNSTEGYSCTDCETPDNQGLIGALLSGIRNIVTPPIPKLNLSCIVQSISNKTASSQEIACEGNSRKRTLTNSCMNEDLAKYIHWSINKALDCISDPKDPIDPNLVFMKVNNESTFRPFYSYKGGKGLMQLVGIAKEEMLGLTKFEKKNGDTFIDRSNGRKFLAAQLAKNAANKPHCQMYKSIFDFESEHEYDEARELPRSSKEEVAARNKALRDLEADYPQAKTSTFSTRRSEGCEDISLSEGIHRNLLAGLGLYLFYRDVRSDSANNILKDTLKLEKDKNPDYQKIRDYLTLGMYGPDGPSGMRSRFRAHLPQIKAKMRDGVLSFEDFKSVMLSMGGRNYYRETQRSLTQVFGNEPEDLQCVSI